MVGKNNKTLLNRLNSEAVRKYAIKKLTVGAASVVVATGLAFMGPLNVSAEEAEVTQTEVAVAEEAKFDAVGEEEPAVESPVETEVSEETPKAEEVLQEAETEKESEASVAEASQEAPVEQTEETAVEEELQTAQASEAGELETYGEDVNDQVEVTHYELTTSNPAHPGVVEPNNGESVYIDMSLNFKPDIKPNDYFTIQFSDNVNLHGDLTYTDENAKFLAPHIFSPTGEIMALGEYDQRRNLARYIFTDYVNNNEDLRAHLNFAFWPSRKNAQESGSYTITNVVGNTPKEDTVVYRYIGNDQTVPANVESHITSVDRRNNTFVSTIYVNPNKSEVYNATVDFYDHIPGQVPWGDSAVELIPGESTYEVYFVPADVHLPASYYVDPEALGLIPEAEANGPTKVTAEMRYNADGAPYLHFDFHDLTSDGTRYVIKINGYLDSTIENLYTRVKMEGIAADGNHTSYTHDNTLVYALSSADGEGDPKEMVGTFQEFHEYYDVVKDYEGNIVSRVENEALHQDGFLQAGNETETYVTEKVDQPGYTFKETTNLVNNPAFNGDGSQASGHYVGNVNQSVTYVYEREVQPGRFEDTHKYYVVYTNAEGEETRRVEQTAMTYTNKFQEGFPEQDTYTATTAEKDGFTFEKLEDIRLIETANIEVGRVSGTYTKGDMQSVTFVYTKTERDPETIQPGTFVERHVYTDVVKDFNGQVIKRVENAELTHTKLTKTGKEGETFTTAKENTPGYTFLPEATETKNIDGFIADGEEQTGHFIAETEQAVTYYYEREVQPGRFEDTHEYYVVYTDGEGKEVRRELVETNTSPFQEGYKDEDQFQAIKAEKDGFTFEKFDENDTPTASMTTTEDHTVSGTYEPGQMQTVTYIYTKAERAPETIQPGTFKETHTYIDVEKDFEGNEISRTPNEEKAITRETAGTEDETYTTEKVEKDGYTFTEVTAVTPDTEYNEDGTPATGHYTPETEKAVDYEYEKVRQPGRFEDTHSYYIVYTDAEGKEVRRVEQTDMRYTNDFQEGYPVEESYTATTDEKDGFTFEKLEDLNLIESATTEEGQVTGTYSAGQMQSVTYVYTKSMRDPETITPGTFTEIHVYEDVEKDFEGNEISRTPNEEVSYTKEPTSGTEDETYTTSKDEKDGYEFTEASDPKGGVEYNEDGSPKEGHYENEVDKSITYHYEQVRQPGRFEDTHEYYIVYTDADGKEARRELVETTTHPFQEGYKDEDQFQATTAEKDGFTFEKFNEEDAPTASMTIAEDHTVSGTYEPGQMQSVTYVYTKSMRDPETITPGTFTEIHEYTEITLDFEGNEISRETKTETKEKVEGYEDETYTTSKDEKDGFEFTGVSGSEGAKYDENGKETNGHFIEEKDLIVTYTYEKVSQPGRFEDAHVYYIIYVDKEGNEIRRESVEELNHTNPYQEGYSDETFFAEIEAEAGFKFFGVITPDTLENRDDYEPMTGETAGYFVPGILQDITYQYVKVVVEEDEIPEEPEVPEDPEKPEEPGKPEIPEGETPDKELPEKDTPKEEVAEEVEVQKQSTLPETGEADATSLFYAGTLSILAGLGLVTMKKREEE